MGRPQFYPDINEEFNTAVKDEFRRICVEAKITKLTDREAELVLSKAKLSVVQSWIDQGRDLRGVRLNPFKMTF